MESPIEPEPSFRDTLESDTVSVGDQEPSRVEDEFITEGFEKVDDSLVSKDEDDSPESKDDGDDSADDDEDLVDDFRVFGEDDDDDKDDF
jgi:hypothetical protein